MGVQNLKHICIHIGNRESVLMDLCFFSWRPYFALNGKFTVSIILDLPLCILFFMFRLQACIAMSNLKMNSGDLILGPHVYREQVFYPLSYLPIFMLIFFKSFVLSLLFFLPIVKHDVNIGAKGHFFGNLSDFILH